MILALSAVVISTFSASNPASASDTDKEGCHLTLHNPTYSAPSQRVYYQTLVKCNKPWTLIELNIDMGWGSKGSNDQGHKALYHECGGHGGPWVTSCYISGYVPYKGHKWYTGTIRDATFIFAPVWLTGKTTANL